MFRFLMVVPEELRSTNKDDFESYMADAERQYRDVCRVSPMMEYKLMSFIKEENVLQVFYQWLSGFLSVCMVLQKLEDLLIANLWDAVFLELKKKKGTPPKKKKKNVWQ